MAGSNGIPASDGPTGPIIMAPSQPPITPTITDARKPPGTVPGTRYAAIQAQALATNKYMMNIRISIISLLNRVCNSVSFAARNCSQHALGGREYPLIKGDQEV